MERRSRSSTVRVQMTRRRVVGLWSPLHHHKAGTLQMSDEPVRGEPGHHTVCMVDPLPTVIAACKRQCLGEFVRRCRAKGWGFRHGATLPRPRGTNQEPIPHHPPPARRPLGSMSNHRPSWPSPRPAIRSGHRAAGPGCRNQATAPGRASARPRRADPADGRCEPTTTAIRRRRTASAPTSCGRSAIGLARCERRWKTGPAARRNRRRPARRSAPHGDPSTTR